VTLPKFVDSVRIGIGLFWLTFQFYIIFYPQVPLVQRPLHLMLALALALLWKPLDVKWLGARICAAVDTLLILVIVVATAYFMFSVTRLTERMETIDPIFWYDIVIGIAVILVMLEAVRRVVGWMLLGVILAFGAYAFLGSWFPGWLRFQGFALEEMVEILTMTANGVLGITTATSVQFVFYFVTFGAIYSATGGGQLFIDIGMRVSGRQKGGAAKAAVISSSLMGSISGSAVANVTATGIFTIPLMRRSPPSLWPSCCRSATAASRWPA
jgi:TRAP-type uncharacterized transport system fused permease subunit